MNFSQFGVLMIRIDPARLATWSTTLLVVLLAYSLAQLTWRVWPRAEEGVTSAPMTGTIATATGTRAQGPGLESLAALHLFGEHQANTTRQGPIEAPETHLDLALRGVVAGQGQMAFAIIASGGRDERAYRVGAHLPGGALLRDIYPDRVILERNGRFETLKLPREAPAAGSSGKNGAGRLPAAVASKLRSYRQKLRRNPQAAFKLVQLTPVVANGRLKGYRIAPRAERDLFRRVGLRSGDVVTQVNGIAVDDPEKIGRALNRDRVALTVERGGRTQTVSVNLQP
jgi:general secretion pathway protein C